MWSELDSYYFDLSSKKVLTRVKTLSSFWTLWANIPNKEKKDKLVKHLRDEKHFNLENPFPYLSRSDSQFEEEGDGYRGSVYSYMLFMIVKGL